MKMMGLTGSIFSKSGVQQEKSLSISIITPTYNSTKTLAACLESIKNQDYHGEFEIIIADGGSTDSTLEIARRYTDNI